jgi:hypothetical protein
MLEKVLPNNLRLALPFSFFICKGISGATYKLFSLFLTGPGNVVVCLAKDNGWT